MTEGLGRGKRWLLDEAGFGKSKRSRKRAFFILAAVY
jgi:hypothetical protein